MSLVKSRHQDATSWRKTSPMPSLRQDPDRRRASPTSSAYLLSLRGAAMSRSLRCRWPLAASLLAPGSRSTRRSRPSGCARAAAEPQNWLTYAGSYASQRYSPLDADRRRRTSKNLELKWMLQNQVFGAWQSTPLVVDGDHVRDAAAERRARASTRRPAACSGCIATRRRRTRGSAAAPTTAASRSSATRCSWARSTRT